MDLIAEHLRRWAASDFVWGVSDCSLVLADYVADVTGIDGALPLRGAYTDRPSCLAIGLGRGLVSVVSECAARVPLKHTETPKRGDIGVLGIRHLEVAGLYLGDRWAIKSEDGVLFLKQPKVLAAWAVP